VLLDVIGAAKWPLTLVRGRGAQVWDDTGRPYWDLYGGHAVTLIGHADPRWTSALVEQAEQLPFWTTMCDVPVRQRAAERLCSFSGMHTVFLVNSGAEANEAALKIARKATGKSVIIAMKHGFHGRTMGALGATWGYRDQHALAHGPTRFVPFGDLEALRDALAPGDVAGVLVEPIQGIAGVVTPPDGYLAGLTALTHVAGALVLADEIQCGSGRTGDRVTTRALGGEPDLLTLAKGLGGGFPVSACLMTEAVAATVGRGEHGTTFGGGPLASAAIEATLDIIESDGLLETASALQPRLRDAVDVPGVVSIRGRGAWLGVVLDRPAGPVAASLRSHGVLVGTSGDPHTLRLAPPAVFPSDGLRALTAALRDTLTGRA
jgi:acetylornithine/N-succinyldiaminopimelate aminotransferase